MFKTAIASALVAFAAASNSTCSQIFTCAGCNANAECGWVKPKTAAEVTTRQCKDAALNAADDIIFEKVTVCEACDTNDCMDCYKEDGCKFWTTLGNKACSKEKPTGITSIVWSEQTEATCKANAASDAVETKCKNLLSCASCKLDSDCLWYVSKVTGSQECNAAANTDVTADTPDTCPECAFSDCDKCQKEEGCKFFETIISASQKCVKDDYSFIGWKETESCVNSPAASVGISAAALAATAVAVLMN